MKYVTFQPRDSGGLDSPRLGVLEDSSVLDLTRAVTLLLRDRATERRARDIAAAVVTSDLVTFLEGGSLATELVRDAMALAGGRQEGSLWWPLDSISLQAPLRPRMLREFSTYESHLTAGGHALPEIYYRLPIYWKGNSNSVVGPGAVIPFPDYTDILDFELEIAAVIGKPGFSVAPSEALDLIAGFTIMNDVSARDMQMAEMSAFLGPAKGKDFCNVLGPALVTPDEIDPVHLRAKVLLNGEIVAESKTDDMFYSWAEMISHASQDEWLLPGDVMSSGTVVGCSGVEIFGFPEAGPILRPGDSLEFEVEGLGSLRNVIGPRREAGSSIQYPGYGHLPKKRPWDQVDFDVQRTAIGFADPSQNREKES